MNENISRQKVIAYKSLTSPSYPVSVNFVFKLAKFLIASSNYNSKWLFLYSLLI